MTSVDPPRAPFVVLWRAFFAQFFTSESVTSDVQLRQTIVWVLAFLLTPGLLLLIEIFPHYQYIVIQAAKTNSYGWVDDTLEWVAFLFVTYSMVTVGFVAVFVWDALTFDRRDAMILGPLPLRGATIVGAKVAALAAFLLAASTTFNLLNAVMFALETADRLGGVVLVKHFLAHLTATVGAATFVFAAIVMIRGTVALLCGARLAAAIGSFMQFLFVVALLSFVILCPAVWSMGHPALVNNVATGWLPTSWFLGLFERLRGSPRTYFDPLAQRAVIATAIAIAGAVIVSIAGYHRQMQLALAPPASIGRLGSAPMRRALARWLAGRDAVARATADFILLTMTRSRAQQAPIAISAAIGVGVVVAGLSGRVNDLAALMRPRISVLWIPLVLAYWTAIGMRASFFVPSELAASWTFQANAPDRPRAYWSAVRGSMIAFVVPPALAVVVLMFAPLAGWRATAWHALVTGAMAVLLVEALSLTIDFIPFTRAYRPGHARLRTLWPIYFVGLYVFAYWPARLELAMMDRPGGLITLVAAVAVAIAALEMWGRRRAGKWTVPAREESGGEVYTAPVLDIGAV